jgi:hypothetical protein
MSVFRCLRGRGLPPLPFISGPFGASRAPLELITQTDLARQSPEGAGSFLRHDADQCCPFRATPMSVFRCFRGRGLRPLPFISGPCGASRAPFGAITQKDLARQSPEGGAYANIALMDLAPSGQPDECVSLFSWQRASPSAFYIRPLRGLMCAPWT